LKGLRLDERLVRDGLADSRTRAQALIRAGQVLVDDTPHDKPGTRVRDDAEIRVRGGQKRYASRGGEKLAGALDAFGLDVAGRLVLDVGASTGGFTDVCLRRGAARVIAVDVGYGQLAWSLRQDPRVTVLDRRNARYLTPDVLPATPDLAVVDVSFISLTLILPGVAAVLAPADGQFVALVKPQFEVGKGEVGKGGVVRDAAKRAGAVRRVRACAEALGFTIAGEAESVLPGPKGNRETFLWGARGIERNAPPGKPVE
jgi:23S rRNA (cytidine1920-2'-O)/16S rRNA (cytidine1409-2'-O)-methyltransferase